MPQRLKTFYLKEIVPKLQTQGGYGNIHQVPEVKKVVINRGLGEASQNAKTLDASLKEVSIIAGQRGVITRSKKAIAGFKFVKVWLLEFQLHSVVNACMPF
jgi:large subunit ribosomal protein L5